MSSSLAFSPRGSNTIHIPLLTLNLAIIGLCAYATWLQKLIYTDGTGGIGAMITLGIVVLGSIYSMTTLVLTFFHIQVGPLARILMDALFMFPGYTASAVTLGMLNEGLGEPGSCSSRLRLSNEYCDVIWRRDGAVQLAAAALTAFAVILIILEFGFSLRHRANHRRVRKEGSYRISA